MSSNRFAVIVLVGILLSVAIAPGVASAQPSGVDECMNADEGPGDNGPPGFVGGLVPDFVSNLIGSLPVPNIVKSFFGASTC